MNAFEVLGLSVDADQQQVHQAYRTRVKACHPDQFVDREEQKKAQEELIRLNLAYEEALKLSAGRQVGYHTVPGEQAKAIARKLLEQGRYESALLQLGRAETKDDEWYYIQGQLMMDMHQFVSAHQSFREAVRLAPDNNEYRRGALEAALAVKKHQKLPYRVMDWADGILHPRKKM
ncbi:MAG: J domain-containing protein [Clostridia bacterium]|nr:J domain-containing protein [Clostridia bacterium]